MTYTILWLVVFLLSGDPVAYTMIMPDGGQCGEVFAIATARARTVITGPIQDLVLWRCEMATSPGPAESPPDEWPLPKSDL